MVAFYNLTSKELGRVSKSEIDMPESTKVSIPRRGQLFNLYSNPTNDSSTTPTRNTYTIIPQAQDHGERDGFVGKLDFAEWGIWDSAKRFFSLPHRSLYVGKLKEDR
ncbi:hypothetical protein MMC28_007228 [Mycoblastus sanguinarius]|nr:hypothetical protein [Mycoblastus sanguinarius]